MALKAVVDKLDDVPESLHGEYKETVDPKTKAVLFVLDLEGYDSLPATRKLKDENGQHRIAAREAKAKLERYTSLGDPDEVLSKLDRIPELEAAAEGKLDEAKISTIVETRVKAKLAPVERERDGLKTQLGELKTENDGLKGERRTRTIHDAVRGALRKSAGFQGTAEEDALLFAERMLDLDEEGRVVTKDGVGVTPGVDAAIWLQEMQPKKTHWWGPTVGGGAGGNRNGAAGGGGANPFSHDHWNITEQGNIARADRRRAEQLAKAAGTTIGGGRPPARK